MKARMKTAVISGGGGGLGRALSLALQARGWRVVLVDLNVAGLEASATQVPIACDLTDVVARGEVFARIIRESASIDLVIYNAGITQIGAFADLSEAALRKVVEINFFAATAMAAAFLRPLRQSKGTHLAMSSVAGFSPLYHRTAYAASKHALEGFFASLRSEEAPYGVRTVIAAPSFIATNPGRADVAPDGTARPGSAGDGIDAMTPEEAAAVILRGVARGRPFIPVGRVAWLSHVLHRLSPRLFQQVMQRNIRGA